MVRKEAVEDGGGLAERHAEPVPALGRFPRARAIPCTTLRRSDGGLHLENTPGKGHAGSAPRTPKKCLSLVNRYDVRDVRG